MRERTTWNREEVIKRAAVNKKADPYTMNQDHPQPPADKYVTGDPSTFAEDVHTPNTWESEYANGQTKRNEIGMPDMRSDTFNHAEKTAADANPVLIKKADLAIAVSRMMLAGKKVASETAIEDQAVALMSMGDRDLIATHKRLAGEDDEQGQDDDQAKQAQDQGDQKDDQAQAKQAQDQDADKKDDQAQAKQAQDQKDDQGQDDKGQQAKQGQDQQKDDQGQQDKQANQQMQMAQQIQQMIQSGNLQQAQEQIQQMIQQAQGQQQQAPQQQQMSDDQALDQMLASDGCGPMSEGDIQMEPAPMDVGIDDLTSEDEVLRTLFADDQQDDGQAQGQQKQAMSRTASSRTVGTRPTAGVARLGGSAAGSTGTTDSVEALSSLWQSAPDVREVFGISKS